MYSTVVDIHNSTMERPVKIDREWGDPDRGGTASTEVKTSLMDNDAV